MSATISLPTPEHTTKIMSGLFGQDAVVRPIKDTFETSNNVVLAGYTDDNGQIHAVIASDFAFANFAGASLTMIAPGVANDGAKAKTISDNIMENFQEVLNIFVNIFSDCVRSHLVLGKVGQTGKLDADLQAAFERCEARVRFEVDIPKYGKGRLALMCC